MEHHAYLLLGEESAAEAYLDNVFSELGISTLGNPDVHHLEENVFLVDHARRLSEGAQVKAFGAKKIFVITAARFTPEAQNALLKTFEEPSADTHFFVVARDTNMFLPTLLSRMQIVRLEGKRDVETEARKFLEMPLSKRVEFARKFADEKEERGVGALSSFLDSLLLILRDNNASLSTLEKVFKVRLFAEDSSAMSRLIIEHVGLVLN